MVPLRGNLVDLMGNPHGALLLSFLLSCRQLNGSDLISAAMPTIHTIFLNRHAVTVLQAACVTASSSTLRDLCTALTAHDNPVRLLGDQGAVSLICACLVAPAMDDGTKHLLVSRFAPIVSRATVHSDQHAEHLAIISGTVKQ